MKLRQLTEEERAKHVEHHPEDTDVESIYEVRYAQGWGERVTLVDAKMVPIIEAAIEFGKGEAQKQMQFALGLARRTET